jgi:hypothetical protein
VCRGKLGLFGEDPKCQVDLIGWGGQGFAGVKERHAKIHRLDAGPAGLVTGKVIGCDHYLARVRAGVIAERYVLIGLERFDLGGDGVVGFLGKTTLE